MIKDKFLEIGEYCLAGLYEEPNRSLFYRKSLALRRYYEKCKLPEYNGKPLYPSGEIKYDTLVRPWYYLGLNYDNFEFRSKHEELSKEVLKTFGKTWSYLPKEHTVGGNMYTHSIPRFERILAEGLLSYEDRINKIEDTDLREGLIHLVSGIKTYLCRVTEYLTQAGADANLINALKRVPLYPARNVYEAIVSWNFVLYLDDCDNLGCLSNGLEPYYKGEDIVLYLENLFDNIDKNDGYSMAIDCSTLSLTIQCLKALRGKRRPMIELFVDENTPNEIWEEAMSAIKSGAGGPAFYNGKVLLKGLKERFPTITDEDIKLYCGGGCTESMIAGLSNVGSLDAGINLLLVFEETLKTYLPKALDFEDFYGEYFSRVKLVVKTVKKEISRARKLRAKYNPLPMRTLLVDDCIDKGVEYNSGGARYNWSIINFAGLVNVIDSMLVVKKFVFDEKSLTPLDLISFLENNDQEFLKKAILSPLSFGKDDKEANDFAHRISSDVFSLTKTGKPSFGEGFLSASIQFNSQAYAGKKIGATPDGRSKGAPLCDSISAIFGKDSIGPTALLNSVTALDLKNALGVPVLNFNVSKHFDFESLKSLILGYFHKGGIHVQITHASKEDLLDAYEHPERHQNLVVRVGGYSEYFNRLPNDIKLMIINRTIQNV